MYKINRIRPEKEYSFYLVAAVAGFMAMEPIMEYVRPRLALSLIAAKNFVEQVVSPRSASLDDKVKEDVPVISFDTKK